MSDENLLITSTSSNKRSLTEHFVDYVKKSKCLFPHDNNSYSSSSSYKRGKFDSFERKTKSKFLFVPGSLCLTYSISNDDHTKDSILTLHGKDLFMNILQID
jgi:hypothetical protein